MDSVSLYSVASSITLGPDQVQIPSALLQLLGQPVLVLTHRPQKPIGSAWFDTRMVVTGQDGEFLGEIMFLGKDWQRGLGSFATREYHLDITGPNGEHLLKIDRGGDGSFGEATVSAYINTEEGKDPRHIGQVQYLQKGRNITYTMTDTSSGRPYKTSAPFAEATTKVNSKNQQIVNEDGDNAAALHSLSTYVSYSTWLTRSGSSKAKIDSHVLCFDDETIGQLCAIPRPSEQGPPTSFSKESMGDLISDTSLPNASLSAVERAIVLCTSILMDCTYHNTDKDDKRAEGNQNPVSNAIFRSLAIGFGGRPPIYADDILKGKKMTDGQ